MKEDHKSHFFDEVNRIRLWSLTRYSIIHNNPWPQRWNKIFRKHNMDMILSLSEQICVRQNKLILLSFYDIQSFEWKYRFGFGMKLLIHPQTSTDASLKFGNGYVISLRMMTSSNGNIFRVTGPLCGEFTGPGEFPTQRPVTRSFDVSFDLRLNKQLSKQPWAWWFETPSWPLWRQCNGKSWLNCMRQSQSISVCYSGP